MEEKDKGVKVKLLTLSEAKELMMEAIADTAFESMKDDQGNKAVVELFAGSKMLTSFDMLCKERFGVIPDVDMDAIRERGKE